MKEGWEYKKLGDVCEILNGFAFKSSRYVSEGIRVIRITNVQKGRVEDNDPKYYPLSSKNEIERYLLREGDLLVSLTGNVGRVGRLPQKLLPAALNQRVACLRLKGKNVNKQYLYHFLNSDYFESICTKNSSGAAQLNLSTVWLANYKIAVPPLSEQQSIVDYLDSAFAKIEAMKANAEKALNEAKALFQASLKEMLEPKEGWEEKTLKETCSVITDGTHHSPINTANGKYKYVTAKNIKPWGLDLKNITFVSEDVHKEIVSRCCPQKGDVLYIKDGATTGIAIVNPLNEEFSLLSSVALIRPNKNIMLSEYLCYALNSPSIYEQTRSQMDGAAITRVTLVKIKGFTIPLPPLSVQQSIVETLDSLKSKVDKLQENYDKISQECDALKQAILRQVFE